MNSKYKIAIVLVLVLLLSFSSGVAVGRFKLFPFDFIQAAYHSLDSNDSVFDTVNPNLLKTNVSSIIEIQSKSDLIDKREKIIDLIWKEKGFPSDKFPIVSKDITDAKFANMPNLKRIDKLEITMEKSVSSTSYIFLPENSNNRLMIYHQGHRGDFILGKNVIEFFLEEGYAVLAFSMPLIGRNEIVSIDSERFGNIQLVSHTSFNLIESSDFSPLLYFFEPIAVSLNYIEEEYDFEVIAMTGISGGGWTTHVYSAIDPRIIRSYPVAGSLPQYVLSNPPNNDVGSYEESHPELLSIANYLDLYIMGSYGENRNQIHILNKFDSCCHKGVGYMTYEGEIQEILEEIGDGSYEVYLDDSHRDHKISKEALQVIATDLQNRG